MQDWAFLRREPILIVRFFHGMSMECLRQVRLVRARLPSFQVQLRAHNFLFGSSFTTCFNYANTNACSFNLASSLTLACLQVLRLAIQPRAQFQNSSILSIQVVSRFTLDKCMFKLLQDFAVKDFFPTSRVTQERKKNQASMSYLLQDLPLSFFCPTSRSS